MKIVLVQRLVPGYRHELFEALRSVCAEQGVDFELWASLAPAEFVRRGTAADLSWAKPLPVTTILGLGLEWQHLPWREALTSDLLVVPDGLRCFSNFALIALRRLLGRTVLTWGHGRNLQPSLLSRTLASLRLSLLRLAHGHLVYTTQCLGTMLAAGVPRQHIAITENAPSLCGAEGLHAQHPEVVAFRTDHGLGNAPCVAFLGSWYPTKRPERIIAIGEAIRREQPDAHIVVLGGGDGLALLRQHEAPWLHVLGPRHGREKFVALAACRCLAVTGIAGLNVLDAMAVARPVVLSRRGGHSPEAIYVRHGVNGLWVEDSVDALAAGCLRLIQSLPLATRLGEAAGQSAGRLTPQSVAATWLTGARHLAQHDEATSARHVVLVYQRMLAYHCARFTALAAELAREGIRCTALEVANTDSSYGDAISVASTQRGGIVSLFPNCDYLSLRPRQVASAVCMALQALRADVVFAPAPAFAEGAGALHHKVRFGGRLLQMDDAWAATDQSGVLVRWVKRSFNGFVDGGFLPDALHGQHFVGLNIPLDRQAYAVDVVGPATGIAEPLVAQPDRRFVLFVGRLIERKGLHTLLNALAQWPASEQRPALVVIGDGPTQPALQAQAARLGLLADVHWLGMRDNAEAQAWMRHAHVLVVPSDFEQWGLVVNEAWQNDLPVLASETVGALRAATPAEWSWTLLSAGDASVWRAALVRALSQTTSERMAWITLGRRQAQRYGLAAHVRSARALIDVALRKRPARWVGWVARLWPGRVVIW